MMRNMQKQNVPTGTLDYENMLAHMLTDGNSPCVRLSYISELINS